MGLNEVINKVVMDGRSRSGTMEVLERNQSHVGDVPVAELIVVASWFIWWQRRQFVKRETIQTPYRIAISIKVLTTNFVRASTAKQPAWKKDHMCKRPNKGRVKINVDA